jgi:hypothetical protein
MSKKGLDFYFTELPSWAPYKYSTFTGKTNFTKFQYSGPQYNLIFGNIGGVFRGPVITATGTNYQQSSNITSINSVDTSNIIYTTTLEPVGSGSVTSVVYSIPVGGGTVTGSGTTATVTIPYYNQGGQQQGHYLRNGTYSGFVITVSGNSTYNQSPGTTITVTSQTQFTYTTGSTISGSDPSLTSVVYTATSGLSVQSIASAAASAALISPPSEASNIFIYSNSYWSNQATINFSSNHPFMVGGFSWANYNTVAGLYKDYNGTLITTPKIVSDVCEDYRNYLKANCAMTNNLGYSWMRNDMYLYNIYISSTTGGPYDSFYGSPTPGLNWQGGWPNIMVDSAYKTDITGFTLEGFYGGGSGTGAYSLTDFGNILLEMGHVLQSAASGTGRTWTSSAADAGDWWFEGVSISLQARYFAFKNFAITPQFFTTNDNSYPLFRSGSNVISFNDAYIGGYRHIVLYKNYVLKWMNHSFQCFMSERIDKNISGLLCQNYISGEDPLDTICRLTGWSLAALFSEWIYWSVNLTSRSPFSQYVGWGYPATNGPNRSNYPTNGGANTNPRLCFTRGNPGNQLDFGTGVQQRWDQFGYFMPVDKSTVGSVTTLTPKLQYLDRCGWEVVDISGNVPVGVTKYTVSYSPVYTNSQFSITGGDYSVSGSTITITSGTVSGTPLAGATMDASSYPSWGNGNGWAYLSNIAGTTYTIDFDILTYGSPSVTSGTVTTPILFNTNLNTSSASDWTGVTMSLVSATGACNRSRSQPLAPFTPSMGYLSSEIVVFGIACAQKIAYTSGNMLVQFTVSINAL